jgi:hypothetical protein
MPFAFPSLLLVRPLCYIQCPSQAATWAPCICVGPKGAFALFVVEKEGVRG